MIRNYLLLAWRNFRRNHIYSLINVLGLSLGISSALVIFSYIHFELNFDRHHTNYKQIFRITETIRAEDGSVIEAAITPARVKYALSDQEFSHVAEVGRLFPYPGYVSTDRTTWVKEDGWVYADSTIGDIFSFPVIAGDLKVALSTPLMVAISESKAKEYFGDGAAVGRDLWMEDESGKYTFTVAAIIENSPANSHFNYDFIASFHSLYTVMPWHISWYHPYLYTYGKLAATGTLNTAQTELTTMLMEALPDWEKENRTYVLQPLEAIHLHSDLSGEWKANARYEYIFIFFLIALFILFIACINFINLATSKAVRRSREVGVRKVMGASRGTLVAQFLGESYLMTLLSFLLAIGFTEWVMLLQFNQVVNRELSLGFLFSGVYPTYLFLSVLVLGLFAGLYPALRLSSFQAATALQNKGSGSKESSRLRKGLVTFQFAISCFLIMGTLVVIRQVDYLKTTRLGYTKDYIMLVRLNSREDQIAHRQLIDRLNQYAEVHSAAVSSQVPGSDFLYDNPVLPENSPKPEGYNLTTLNVGPEFGQLYDLTILEGRDFSIHNPADVQQSVLINESAAELFGWTLSSSIGRKLDLTWYTDSALVKHCSVIGVVEDFYFGSLKSQIVPMVLHINTHPYYTEYISVRFTETGYAQALQLLEKEWTQFSPEKPLEATFLEHRLNQLYKSETQAGKILSAFAILAILVSCLGLFGLSAYAAESRTKEIGIRKTMGASVGVIVRLLAKDFMLLIILGSLIGIPVAVLFCSRWLNNFLEKTDIAWWTYAITVLLAILVGFLTVSFQSFKAALTNPTESLKNE